MKKFRCKVCGYVHEGDSAPEKCPICGKGPEFFEEMSDAAATMEWAVEHKLGAVGDDEEMKEKLRMFIQGEVSEVGMYLAMARLAYRDGYPEIGEVLKNIAWEEAEHAAIFNELLGEAVEDTVEANLKKMINGENGACAARQELALLAKQKGNDAVHDAVHETARDEARHGRALEGLVKRFFS